MLQSQNSLLSICIESYIFFCSFSTLALTLYKQDTQKENCINPVLPKKFTYNQIEFKHELPPVKQSSCLQLAAQLPVKQVCLIISNQFSLGKTGSFASIVRYSISISISMASIISYLKTGIVRIKKIQIQVYSLLQFMTRSKIGSCYPFSSKVFFFSTLQAGDEGLLASLMSLSLIASFA